MARRALRLPQVQERIPYSAEHIRRLEMAGKFPKRFKLNPGSGRQGAVGWWDDEIERHAESIGAAASSVAA